MTFAPATDAHVHLMPQRLMAAIREALERDLGWACDHPVEPTALESALRAQGVDRYVALPYAHEAGLAENLNRWVLEQAGRSELAVPFATVHPEDDVRAVVRDALNAGARGLKLQCPVQEASPDDPRLDPAFELCSEYDRPVLLHAGAAPNFEDSPHVGIDSFRTFVASYPDVRVCAAHMGAPDVEAFVAEARAHDQVFLDTSVAMSSAAPDLFGLDPDDVDDDVFEDLAGSILYGSDFPNVPYDYEREREHLLSRDLSGDAFDALFRGAADRFLGTAD
ncbi:amidohydrolase family protein [Haloarchaeobius sp. HRN-SO-5]|uniref:amidohydrolase family protein n=1 Tax=Haloarchaeobius sp. HRN-SO-5 TaxID=3446118 RepID=UPI003EC0FA11